MIEYSFSIQELEILLLYFVRVTCFIYAAPFYSMNNTPNQFKIGLGLFVSYLLYAVSLPHQELVYGTVLEYAVIVMREALVGLIIGWGANICSSIVLFAGRLVDMEIGFAMVNAIDPTTKENATISGFYYQYTVMLLLIVSGMHRYILQALAQTYELIPVNGAVFRSEPLMKAVIGFMSQYINIGFQICLPIFCVTLIVNVVLGILAKVAPQMNMFAVGMQIKILIGLGVMFLTVGMLPYVSDYIYKEMKIMIVSFVEAIMHDRIQTTVFRQRRTGRRKNRKTNSKKAGRCQKRRTGCKEPRGIQCIYNDRTFCSAEVISFFSGGSVFGQL